MGHYAEVFRNAHLSRRGRVNNPIPNVFNLAILKVKVNYKDILRAHLVVSLTAQMSLKCILCSVPVLRYKIA